MSKHEQYSFTKKTGISSTTCKYFDLTLCLLVCRKLLENKLILIMINDLKDRV